MDALLPWGVATYDSRRYAQPWGMLGVSRLIGRPGAWFGPRPSRASKVGTAAWGYKFQLVGRPPTSTASISLVARMSSRGFRLSRTRSATLPTSITPRSGRPRKRAGFDSVLVVIPGRVHWPLGSGRLSQTGGAISSDGTDSAGRCAWARGSDLDVAYHDLEWGVPRSDDRMLFEALTLEGAQAGLSWSTILKKRDGYREAFRGFDPVQVASMGASDVERLLENPGIVRHRGKIESTLSNASRVLEIQAELGSFARYIWSFVDGRPVFNRWARLGDLPAETPVSKAMSKDLKRRGFRFVGPTTCYAFMQAAGLVNDHEVVCFRHAEIERLGRAFDVP